MHISKSQEPTGTSKNACLSYLRIDLHAEVKSGTPGLSSLNQSLSSQSSGCSVHMGKISSMLPGHVTILTNQTWPIGRSYTLTNSGSCRLYVGLPFYILWR